MAGYPPGAAPPAKVRIGMLGAGVVGGGVVEVLRDHPEVEFRKICVRNPTKARDFTLPDRCEITDNPEELLADDIDCLVEVAGGTGAAYDLMIKAMSKGKSVVTANKAAISMHLSDLAVATETAKVPFLFEAAVCGGIPIINTLRSGLNGDEVQRIVGIMNGTTNYILSRMAAEGVAYMDVLKDAQKLGYAEADPAADVEGWDARSKLCILAKLGFGITLDEKALWCQGITRLRKDDFEYAKMLNCNIKILGVTAMEDLTLDSNGTVTAWVSPHFVKAQSPIAVTNGPTNLISIRSKNIGDSTYIGAGAGRWPTAQSVVADILRVKPATAAPSPAFGGNPKNMAGRFERDFEASWYLRVTLKDEIGALARVTGMLADAGISIFSVLQTPITDRDRVTCAITTDDCRLSQIERVVEKMAAEIKEAKEAKDNDDGIINFMLEEPFYMPFFERD